jgi:hypothetical protein
MVVTALQVMLRTPARGIDKLCRMVVTVLPSMHLRILPTPYLMVPTVVTLLPLTRMRILAIQYLMVPMVLLITLDMPIRLLATLSPMALFIVLQLMLRTTPRRPTIQHLMVFTVPSATLRIPTNLSPITPLYHIVLTTLPLTLRMTPAILLLACPLWEVMHRLGIAGTQSLMRFGPVIQLNIVSCMFLVSLTLAPMAKSTTQMALTM